MTLLRRFVHAFKRAQNDRLYRRITTDVPVTIRHSSGAQSEKIVNWSPSGLLVTCSKGSVEVGTILDAEFSLGEKNSMLRLHGQVVRHTPDGQGMGIMFTDLTEAGLHVLREVLVQVDR